MDIQIHHITEPVPKYVHDMFHNRIKIDTVREFLFFVLTA